MITKEQAIEELKYELALYMEGDAEGVNARLRMAELEDAIDRLEHEENVEDVLSGVLYGR